MNNKIKKLIATVSLGLMVGIGVSATTHMAKAFNTSNVQAEVSTYDDFEILGIEEYTNLLVDYGYISREQGDLEISYYNATTDENKQKAFAAIVDYHVSKGSLTQEEGNLAKELGHDGDFPQNISSTLGL